MEQETTLSIIIPLYNCEKYIKHCLDSILAQGLNKSDFEMTEALTTATPMPLLTLLATTTLS